MTNDKYLKKLEGFDTSFYDVKAAVEDITPGSFEKLNYISRVLAENLLRKCPSEDLKDSLVQLIEKRTDKDFPWYPSRVVTHDILGLTALVDLAGLREAVEAGGGDPRQVNPVVPTQLIVDHSLAVECGGFDPEAFQKNRDIEKYSMCIKDTKNYLNKINWELFDSLKTNQQASILLPCNSSMIRSPSKFSSCLNKQLEGFEALPRDIKESYDVAKQVNQSTNSNILDSWLDIFQISTETQDR